MKNDNFPSFVGNRVAGSHDDNGPRRSVKYDYVIAGNGLFVSAVRREFEICLPVRSFSVPGIPPIAPHVIWHVPAVPRRIWQEIIETAREPTESVGFREEVFVLRYNHEDAVLTPGWEWARIGRDRTAYSALADDSHPAYRDACIEFHTHPPNALDFSVQDDRDESGKFRFFGIVADIGSANPKARFRCGVHDHFFQLPAAAVAGEGLPGHVIDLNLIELFRVATS